jgi:hypothetical protein
MQLAPAAAGEVLLESMRAQDFSGEAVAQMRALMFTLIARHAHAQVRSHDVTASCAILLDGRLETETEEEVARSLLPVFEQAGIEAAGIRGIAERLIAQCHVLDPFDDVLRNGDLT